jgi:hypothetical protein
MVFVAGIGYLFNLWIKFTLNKDYNKIQMSKRDGSYYINPASYHFINGFSVFQRSFTLIFGVVIVVESMIRLQFNVTRLLLLPLLLRGYL